MLTDHTWWRRLYERFNAVGCIQAQAMTPALKAQPTRIKEGLAFGGCVVA
jgi:hypothetical protein